MKKIGITFSLFAAAVTLQAASTCETRVDSHPKATTLERVDYCLTPEKEGPKAAGPEVIYTGITDKTPEKTRAEKNTPLKQKYYDEESVEISHGYVGTSRFPVLKNDILSERELQEKQAQEALQDKPAEKPTRKMKTKKTKTQTQVTKTQTTTVTANAKKPARTMTSVQETVVETTTTQEPAAPTDIPETVVTTETNTLVQESTPVAPIDTEDPFSLE